MREKKQISYIDDRFIKPIDRSKSPCVIVDIDGTCALRTGRSPFDYDKCDTDEWDERMARLLNLFVKQKIHIIFVTGREETCREKTDAWLQQYVSHYTLIMRKQGDHRKDTIYKEEVYHTQIENDFDVVAVFEDRDQTTKMWRDLGLLTCQVYYGNF